jgi:formate-dependent nitrite reductase membrane component NrfD
MFAQSAISGLAVVSMVGSLTGQGSAYSWTMGSGTLVLAAAMLCMVGYLLFVLSRSNAAGKESAHLLSTGEFSRFFVAGVVLGLIIPSCLTGYALVFNGYLASAATVASGALVLAGGFLFRLAILKSGVRDPLIEDAELTRRFERRQHRDAADIPGVARQ